MVTNGIANLLIRRPQLMKWSGLVLGLGFLALALVLWFDWQEYGHEPTALSLGEGLALVQAGEKPWVELTDLQWLCALEPGQGLVDRQSGNTTRTYALFADADGTPLGVAFFSGQRDCEELQAWTPGGVLSPLTAQSIEEYAEWGLVHPPGSEGTLALKLCSYCGGNNTAIGVYVCLALGVAMLALWPISSHLIRQEAAKNRSARFL